MLHWPSPSVSLAVLTILAGPAHAEDKQRQEFAPGIIIGNNTKQHLRIGDNAVTAVVATCKEDETLVIAVAGERPLCAKTTALRPADIE